MKIERNIPMPAVNGKARKELAPVESMEVGDSIFFDNPSRTSAMGRVRAACMLRNLHFNFKSATEAGGVRVWRTS